MFTATFGEIPTERRQVNLRKYLPDECINSCLEGIDFPIKLSVYFGK